MARLLMNTVIGGGAVNAPFQAPIGATQPFTVTYTGPTVTAAWYVPIDNIGDLLGFDHIEVAPTPASANALTLTIKPNRAALLRILLYGD
jgi:hypothetical protein